MAGEEGGGRVGRVGDERVERVSHLRAEGGSLVECHVGLVLSIDHLVGKETGSRDHGGGHAVTDKEDHVLGGLAVLATLAVLLDLRVKGKNSPCCLLGLSTVKGEDDLVGAGVVKLDVAVRLGDGIDEGLLLGNFVVEVGIVAKAVLLDCKLARWARLETHAWGPRWRRTW